MSNYWDLGCVDCKAEFRIHANHGEKEIVNLITAAPALAKLEKEHPGIVISLTESFGIYGDGCREMQLHWFVEHEGHKLSPVSEYGYYLKDCPDSVHCKECGAYRRCLKPADHEGDHDPDYKEKA